MSAYTRLNPRVFIYALMDPRDDTIRYVGRSRDPMGRFIAHVSKSAMTYPGNLRRYAWTRELAALGLRPILMILEKCALGDAEEAEQRWIDRYRSRGTLYNATANRTRLVPIRRYKEALYGYK